MGSRRKKPDELKRQFRFLQKVLGGEVRPGFAVRVGEVFRRKFFRVRTEEKKQYADHVIGDLHQEKGMAYNLIAKLLGIQPSALSEIVNGKRPITDAQWDLLHQMFGHMVQVKKPSADEWNTLASMAAVSFAQKHEFDVPYERTISREEWECLKRTLCDAWIRAMAAEDFERLETLTDEILDEVHGLPIVETNSVELLEDVMDVAATWGPTYLQCKKHIPGIGRQDQ